LCCDFLLLLSVLGTCTDPVCREFVGGGDELVSNRAIKHANRTIPLM